MRRKNLLFARLAQWFERVFTVNINDRINSTSGFPVGVETLWRIKKANHVCYFCEIHIVKYQLFICLWTVRTYANKCQIHISKYMKRIVRSFNDI